MGELSFEKYVFEVTKVTTQKWCSNWNLQFALTPSTNLRPKIADRKPRRSSLDISEKGHLTLHPEAFSRGGWISLWQGNRRRP